VTTAVGPAKLDLACLLGDSRVVSDPAACAAYAVDGQIPKVVVYPATAEQVAAALRCAAEHRLAVVPVRNATRLGIGNPPRRYDVALALKDMNRVCHYEPADLTVSVEPGMKFSDFQGMVSRDRLWLPLDPPAAPRASLGGILATNSAGPLRLRFGAPRDMVLGMKIATTEGKVIKTGGQVVKNVAGYDLAKLLVGSYGTLGVIVEASLKLCPLPVGRSTFVLSAKTLDAARNLRRKIIASPLQPLRMVLLDAEAASLSRLRSTPVNKTDEIWIEAGGSAKVIERYSRELEALGREAGELVTRLDAESAETLWTKTFDIGASRDDTAGVAAALRASLPVSTSEEFLDRARQECENARMRLASLCQLGVGIVSLYLLEGNRSHNLPGLTDTLRRVAAGLGGTIVVENCPANFKQRVDIWGPPGDDFEVMRKLKLAWDPKGILSPGRFVGGI
jgi:glycolate oxidase FAD binding subunit